MRQFFTGAIVAIFGIIDSPLAHELAGEALYLGNEGVLVGKGEVKVLFDAFYADSYNRYVLVPGEIRKALIVGAPPYDGIDALFVSHIHGDHFTAEPTLAYLRAQPDVVLYGPQSVVDALVAASEGPDDPVLKRLVAFDLKPGDSPGATSVGSIEIDVVAIPHSGGERMAGIRNLVFRATLGEWPTVIHMGDAATDDEQFARLQNHWDAKHANTAFPPYWFLLSEEGRSILKHRIKADQVIGVHVPAEAGGQGGAWREEAGGDLFTDPGESRAIGHPH